MSERTERVIGGADPGRNRMSGLSGRVIGGGAFLEAAAERSEVGA